MKGGSYIQNRATGIKTTIEDRNGAFVFDIWVPGGNDQGSTGYRGKYWQELAENEEDNVPVGFVGLDDLI